MDYSAYLRTLLSVWVGLGLGQLVQALHRVARFRGTVRWDWLPITWAAFAFLMIVQTWWAYFTLMQSPLWANLFAFLLPLSVFVVLYLICASALPDASRMAESDTVDLATFYRGQHRYFFGLWTVLLVLALMAQVVSRGEIDILGEDGFRLAGIGAGVALAWTPDRRVHTVLTLLALALLLVYIVVFSLRLA